jgi:uncharacterized repeat protein (TIGR03803 family)
VFATGGTEFSKKETVMTKLASLKEINIGGRNSLSLARGLLFCALAMLALPTAQGQTFRVIHSFTGGGDGYQPFAGLTLDQGGNLYGTTTQYVEGTVFEMKHRNGSWTLNTLYEFGSGEWIPQGRIVPGPGGALYGTTSTGGNSNCTEFGCGTVYGLRPPQTICRSFNCLWSAAIVSLMGNNGWQPGFVDPAFDAAGKMYITTTTGGVNFDGNVVQLTRSGGVWTASSIHDFNGADGYSPYSGVTFDSQGNMYGTTWLGGPYGAGTIYRLTPSGSGWTFETLYAFPNLSDGALPVGGLVLDQAGNLYGTTQEGGSGNGGTVFELSPSGGAWHFTVLYSFTGTYGPLDTLTMDAAGNLYGTTFKVGAFGQGSVFKLTRNNGSWSFTDLHDFTGASDGANSVGSVALDPGGNMYGTTSAGGLELESCFTENNPGCGTVWEITP